MKNYFLSGLIFVTSLFISSCNKKIDSTESAKVYVEDLKTKSLINIKAQLRVDKKFIEELIKKTETEITYTSHFSAEKAKIDKSVPEFSINYNILSTKELFNDYCKNLYFDQNFSEITSDDEYRLYSTNNFEFKSNNSLKSEDSTFKKLESSITFKNDKYYHSGKSIKNNDILLKRIDSITTEIALEVPLYFEKIIIDKNQKSIIYNKEEIEIQKITKNTIELKVPQTLIKKIIGFQSYNNDWKRMSSSAFSSDPIYEINRSIISSLKEINKIFTRIINENNESFAKKYLENISQEQFDAKNSLLDFKNNFEEIVANNKKTKSDSFEQFKIFNSIIKIGRKVLSSTSNSFVVDFPDDIKQVTIFIAKDIIALKSLQNVKYDSNIYYDKMNPNIIYSKYIPNKGFKYGLTNKKGNKITEAKFDKLKQVGNYYFINEDRLFWLDKNKSQLVSLPKEFKSYYGTIKPNYDVLGKEINNVVYYGIVKGSTETILEFKYQAIARYGNIIFAEKPESITFLDLNFNPLPNKGIIKINKIDDYISTDLVFPLVFEAENQNRKKALLDENLKALTSYKYEFIKPFYGETHYYMAGIRPPDNDSDYLYGIIDDKGREVVPFIFSYINPDNEDINRLNYQINEKRNKMNILEFINNYKNR